MALNRLALLRTKKKLQYKQYLNSFKLVVVRVAEEQQMHCKAKSHPGGRARRTQKRRPEAPLSKALGDYYFRGS